MKQSSNMIKYLQLDYFFKSFSISQKYISEILNEENLIFKLYSAFLSRKDRSHEL